MENAPNDLQTQFFASPREGDQRGGVWGCMTVYCMVVCTLHGRIQYKARWDNDRALYGCQYGETEFDDFIEWLQRERIEPGELEEDDYESDCFVELFDDWRNSDDYQHKQVDYEMEDWDSH